MEESKAPNTNSVIAKFKSLKKPYQIAIIVGVVAAVVVLIFLLSSPKTPFDGIQDYPTIEIVRQRYGQESKYSKAMGEIDYNSYDWLGYNGNLWIYFDYTGNVYRAAWFFEDDSDEFEAYNKMCKSLNRKFGKGEGDSYVMTWKDKQGNEYELSHVGDVIFRFKR